MVDLPAVPLPAEIDLKAMPIMAVKDWLEDVLPRFVLLERWTDEARVLVGIALWRYRSELGETAYSMERERLARLVDRSTRTLDNWRSAVENRLGLQPSSPEAKGKREARQRQVARRVQPPDQPKRAQVVDNLPPIEATAIELERPAGLVAAQGALSALLLFTAEQLAGCRRADLDAAKPLIRDALYIAHRSNGQSSSAPPEATPIPKASWAK